MFRWLKKSESRAVADLTAELDAARAEIGRRAEEMEELEAENDALRFGLTASHEKHAGTVFALVEFVNAAVLAYGNEAGELRLSGDTRALASTMPDPVFKELEDGDVVIRIPSAAEAAEPLTEGDE
jgi:hypothetical protein